MSTTKNAPSCTRIRDTLVHTGPDGEQLRPLGDLAQEVLELVGRAEGIVHLAAQAIPEANWQLQRAMEAVEAILGEAQNRCLDLAEGLSCETSEGRR